MRYWRKANARIAKPSTRLTPEEDAARFVLAWERRMIRNGRAWRKPNPNGSTYAGNRVFTWLAVPYWTRHARRYDKTVGKFGDWVDGPLVSVPQSVLVLRPEGCTCDQYVHGRHEYHPRCPLWRPVAGFCSTCNCRLPCHHYQEVKS